MRIVVDVGAAKHGGDQSVPHLVAEYGPDVLIGLDLAESFADEAPIERVDSTLVIRIRAAAWTHTGWVPFAGAGLGGHVTDNRADDRVPSIDLADLLRSLTSTIPFDEVILKMDAEGAEYVLLPHLADAGVDEHLALAIIEWHCEDCGIGGNGRHRENCPGDHVEWEARRARTEALIRCPLAEWNL